MHVGYFAGFNESNTLLVEADVEEIRELHAVFQSLAAGRIKRFIVHRLPFVRTHHGVELRAACGGDDRGARRCGPGNSFLWERSSIGWSGVAEKLAVLAATPGPCHQYLDSEQDDVVVQLSKGEYGDEWWSRNG